MVQTQRTLIGAGILALLLLLRGSVSQGEEEPKSPVPRLLINGQAAPLRQIQGAREPLIPLVVLCARLGARLRMAPNARNSVALTRGKYRAQLQIGSSQVIHSSSSPAGRDTVSALTAPLTRFKGELYIPVSLAEYLGASVTRLPAKREIRISARAETPEAQEDEWKRLLGVPARVTLPRTAFAITRFSVAAPGPNLKVGMEVVLNLELSAPGYVQIYAIDKGKAQPLFGQVDEESVLFPQKMGAKPWPQKVETRLHLPLRVSSSGDLCFVALAVTQPTEVDLKDALQGGALSGEWAAAVTRREYGARR